jgi:hypothetical protein
MPPRWDELDKMAKVWGATVQMPGRVGMDIIHRFRERYRVAKSLNGLNLSGYSNNTKKGYMTLLKVFLTYTAFESTLPIIGVQYSNGRYLTESLLLRYPVNEWLIRVREIENRIHTKTRFFEKVNNFLTGKYITGEVTKYLNHESCNYFALPAAISNSFAHGKLTPGITDAKKTCEICQLFIDTLFKVIDKEFCCFLDAYHKEANDLWKELQW